MHLPDNRLKIRPVAAIMEYGQIPESTASGSGNGGVDQSDREARPKMAANQVNRTTFLYFSFRYLLMYSNVDLAMKRDGWRIRIPRDLSDIMGL